MKIAKWGNSLAIRIPADVARELGVKEGDDVTLRGMRDEEIALFTDEQRRAGMIERLRRNAVPAPPDFKFDREEANSR